MYLHVKTELSNLHCRTREARESVELLERSLDAQVRFNTVLASEETRAVEKLSQVHQRIDSAKARMTSMDSSISLEQQRLRGVQQEATARRANLDRLEASLHERDSDVVRQKRDASFARRILLGEVEHAREQTAWLDELLVENQRLKLLTERLGALPGMTLDDGNDATDAESQDDDVDDSNTSGAAANSSSNSKSAGLAQQKRKKGKKSSRKSAVQLYQQHNLQLLQQMVNSMQLLQEELSVPKATSHK